MPALEKKEIKITDLSPNDYNPQAMDKRKYRGLVNHIRTVGFTDPLKVRPLDKEGGDTMDTPYVLVDGEHRLRAYMEVYPDSNSIPCVVMMKKADGKPFTRKDAYISTIAYNFQHGEEDQVKLAAVLRMALDEGMLIEDIEDLTGMKRNRIENVMDFLSDLPDPEGLSEDFTGADEEVPEIKDPVIIRFAVYPEELEVIEKALKEQKKELPPETDVYEERGKLLLIMAQKILGQFKPQPQQPEEDVKNEKVGKGGQNEKKDIKEPKKKKGEKK